MKHLLAAFFMIATCCFAQDEALIQIINADSSLEIRQKKIDSLVKIKDLESPSETLGEFYHDLGSKWYQNNWWDYGKTNDDIEKALHKLIKKKSR